MNEKSLDCVFLHGWGVKKEILINLSKGIDCVGEPMIPCLYEMTRLANKYSFVAIAKEIEKTVHRESIVIGWSIGGLIATRLALLTKKVKAIVFIASVPRFINNDGWKNTIDKKDFDDLKKSFNKDPLLTLESFAGLISIGEKSAKDSNRKLRKFIMDETINKNILANWLIELENTDLRKDLSSLNIPMLFVMGNQDALIDPKVVDRLKELLPKARFDLVKNCGHAPFISMTNETQNLINNFINDVNY